MEVLLPSNRSQMWVADCIRRERTFVQSIFLFLIFFSPLFSFFLAQFYFSVIVFFSLSSLHRLMASRISRLEVSRRAQRVLDAALKIRSYRVKEKLFFQWPLFSLFFNFDFMCVHLFIFIHFICCTCVPVTFRTF